MTQRVKRIAGAVAIGLLRSTTFAACGLIVPACVALLPTLAALRLWGSPWSWTNPWSWGAMVIITVAASLALAHPVATLFRRLILRWAGIRVDPGYREQPTPIKLSTGFWWNGSSYERSQRDAQSNLRVQRLKEPAYWREVRWVLVSAIAVAIPGAVPAALVLIGAGMIIGVDLGRGALPVVGLGVLLIVAGVAVSTRVWRIVLPLARRLLGGPEQPARDSGELLAQRAELTAAHDAEIRRIERDLHDGAQSRLVAVGLDLAVAERLIRTEPERAEQLLRSARTATSASLNDLRELVHGVYPPVLIERGLVPAIRELALNSPIGTTVDGPDDLIIESPLAAAIYFSVTELLTNATKHAHATQVSVTITSTTDGVEVTVHDNGSGGAALRPGGGLDGVRRRLVVFDATLEISSPTGGPTDITVKVPCESS